jgi:arsenite methyltransferase
MTSAAQQQTANSFGFQWKQKSGFDTPETRAMTKAWLLERYGDVANASWWDEYGDLPKVLDAGCGAGLTAIEMFGPILHKIDYLGVEISDAYEVAVQRFKERNLPGRFEQGDMTKLALPDESLHVILAEGTLHHTDSTEEALKHLAGKLRFGGRFLFYVYRKKSPIREFTDDYIREKLQDLTPEQKWDALYPLTKLGKMLGDLNLEVDVPETVELLGIPSGKIDIQRLFYWHVFKAYYRPEFSLDEMNHTNFDWYGPKNAHRQTVEEVKKWCVDLGMKIERLVEEPAGITVIAKKI